MYRIIDETKTSRSVSIGDDIFFAMCFVFKRARHKQKMSERKEFIPFKQQHTLAERKQEFDSISARHEDRCPVICEPRDLNHDPIIDKAKFLIPKDLTVGQFMYIVRKRIQLNPEESLFLMTGHHGNVMLPNAMNIYDAYLQYRDKNDGFLYVIYTLENTFG